MAQWVGVQRQVKVAKKSKNNPTCSGPRANPQPKTKTVFFQIQAEDLLNP